MKENYRDKFWRKALGEARKKIKILPDRKLEENLEYAAGSLAEAYRIGVEEAQGEIITRLQGLQAKLVATTPAVSASEQR